VTSIILSHTVFNLKGDIEKVSLVNWSISWSGRKKWIPWGGNWQGFAEARNSFNLAGYSFRILCSFSFIINVYRLSPFKRLALLVIKE
jgi:hypothetical protein